MKKSVIVLVGHNSPCFPSHAAAATMSIDNVWYEYKEFHYPTFEKLNKNEPGRMLAWLKENAKSVRKLEGGA